MAFLLYTSLISNTTQIFDRLAKEWSLILYLSIIVTVFSISEASSNCNVNGIYYLCNNITTKTDFPLVLPTNVRKVTLRGTHELHHFFPSGRFIHPTWANVSELSILEFTNVDRIENGILNGLKDLKFLSVSSCTDLDAIDNETFYYTPNTEELHLDGNTELNLYVVEAALNNKLSNLRFLSLIAIQGSQNHVVLGDAFSKALLGKNVTSLDISRVNVIYVEHAIVQDVFGNLKYLNLSYSTILGMRDIPRRVIQNIELLDLTGVRYNLWKDTIQGERQMKWVELLKPMYSFLQGLYHVETKLSVNVRLRFDNCDTKFPKMLDFSKNSLARLNITFIGISRGNELETINLEGNNMEYISPNFLSIFLSLKILDLSNNHLAQMQDMDDFSVLFSENKDLEIVFLRKNHLTFVPSNLFISNSKLRIIDLSENELSYFNINLHNLASLTSINLRRNRLRSLPVSILEHFEPQFWKQNTGSNQIPYFTNVLLRQFQDKILIGKRYRYGYNASEEIQFEESHSIIPQHVMIDISENQLTCDCDTLVFIEWIIFKNIDIINKTGLSCKYRNNEELLNIELFQMVQTNCWLASSIGIGVAASIVLLISIFTFAIKIRLRRKSARRNQDLENLKKEILQENANFKFLVFLSYCSKDAEVVDKNILPSLNRYFHQTFNTEKDLVCTGENDFVPGMRIIEEIHRCIDQSLVVVPVITPAFLQSDWSQEECVAAVDRHRQVVILMKKHTDTSRAIVTIQNLIGQYTRGTWWDNKSVFDIGPSWNIICEGIIHAASEALRRYREHKFIEPAEDHPFVEEIV